MYVDKTELMRIMADAVQIGYMQAIKAYEPANDAIRCTKIKQWLKHMLIPQKHFDTLVKSGMITPFRKGTARNSPLFYSKSEIKKALTVAKLSTLQ